MDVTIKKKNRRDNNKHQHLSLVLVILYATLSRIPKEVEDMLI